MPSVASARSPEQVPDGAFRDLTVMAVAMVLAMTTWFSAAAVLGELREVWSLSRVAGSWLTIGVQIGFVIGAVISSVTNLADLIPPRRLVLIGAIGAAAANLAMLWVPGLGLALVTRVLTGGFLALVYPSALKATATWFRVRRGVALGTMVGVLTLGSALPHLVASIGGIGWRLILIITSGLTVIGGLLADRVARDGPYPFGSATFDPRRVMNVFADRRVRLASVGYFGHMWELYAMWSWFGAFYADLLEGQGVSHVGRWASLATFVVIAAGALGSWAGGQISDRFGRELAAGSAMTLSGSLALFIGFLVDAPPLVVLALGVFWGFWVVADSAQFSTMVSEVAEQASVGTALTTQLASGFVLSVFTIFLVPVVADGFSWGWAFLLLAPGPALGTYAMARLRRIQAEMPPEPEPESERVFISPFI